MRRVVSAFVLAVSLVSAQSGLRVNEAYTGTPDYFEIANLGPDIVYMAGYKAYWGCNTGASGFQSGSFTFPAGTVLYPGGRAIITDTVGASSPVTPAGVYKAYVGSNILWATTPTGTPATDRNGVVALVDPFNVGLDRVQWGTNTANFDTVSFGAVFTGVVTMTGAGCQRINNADTNLPADWLSSSIPTPGNLNGAGQSVIVGLTHVMTATGGGGMNLVITTANPALPGVEVYNLLSLQDFTPTGTGPFFGIGTDALNLALTPVAIGNPFHTFLDGAGSFALPVPAGIVPPGIKFEGVAFTVVGGLINRISTVSEVVL
jgi:hypothetical protein